MLYYTILYYTILYYTILYYTILYLHLRYFTVLYHTYIYTLRQVRYDTNAGAGEFFFHPVDLFSSGIILCVSSRQHG
jgi:hypothetical protein